MAFVNVKPASTGHSNHQFNPVTVSSLDYGQFVATRVVEVNPGDHFKNVACNSFLRLSPQIFPAYGKTSFHAAAFYVPEEQLLESSKAFHSNMSTYKGHVVVMPYVHTWEINGLFCGESTIYPLGTLATMVGYTTDPQTDTANIPASEWDYHFMYPIIDSASIVKFGYFKLTHLGKIYYKILKSLGFDFKSYPSIVTTGYTRAQINAMEDFTPNILPLLAYAKIYTDMFLNGHTYNGDVIVKLLRDIHDGANGYNGFTQVYDSTTGHASVDLLAMILREVSVPHLRNFYLDAWNQPNSPTGATPDSEMLNANDQSLVSPYLFQGSNAADSVSNSAIDTYMHNHNGDDLKYISTFGQKFLDVVYRFVKRNNLFGNSSFDRFFARFGIKPKSDTVIKLVEGKSDIDFSAVMANSDTYSSALGTGKRLGSYAGFGVCSLKFKFNYKSDSYGYIIVLNWMQFVPMLVHGFMPSVLRKYPKDWYTPEFDGQTLRAIPMCEISGAKGSDLLTTNGDTKVYGFMNLYDDYRFQRDMVLGDFVTERNTSQFLFARDMSYYRLHGSVKMAPLNKSTQYYNHSNNPDCTNPFQESALVADRFFLQCSFDMSASRLAKSRSGALDLNGEGDLSLALGGNELV